MDGSSIFREELAIRYPDHGHALWEPDPDGLYEAVEVGDVGFIRSGYFHRLFNALRIPDAPSNPESPDGPKYPPKLQPKNPHHIRQGRDNHQDFFSSNITKRSQDIYASGPDDATVTFVCSGKQGALLYLPFLAEREETTARGDFSKWIIKYIDDCFKVAEDLGYGVSRIEDIVLVTGRHLAKSWVSAAFSSGRGGAEVSFRTQVCGDFGVNLMERDVSGGELKLGPTGENLPENQCIFVQGYRVARILNIWPRIRAAGSAPDMHEPEPESDVQLEHIGNPSEAEYPDPLRILLEYIAEQASNSDMILVHDNDLGLIGDALQSDTLMERIRNHGPAIRQVRCVLGNESRSDAGAKTATVATLSQDLFEPPREDHDILEPVIVMGIDPQTPQRSSNSPSLPHGTKRKLSSSDENMPSPSGNNIDSQLIGPGVPSSSSITLESPAFKRRGFVCETRGVGQTDIFGRRHSIDARPTSGGPQWWNGDQRDTSSSMLPSPSVSYDTPVYSTDSPLASSAPFAWHSTHSDQPSTAHSEVDGPSSGRPPDPSAVPRIAMALPAESPMSTSTYLTSGGLAPVSLSAVPSPSITKESGLTPYSRSPAFRVSHKLAEQKRRSGLKDLFDELRDQLPVDRGLKASKWEILSKAIDFIAQLKQNNQDMGREIDMLRHELESMRSGVPSLGSDEPHHSVRVPGSPGVGHALPPHQPPPVPAHQAAPPPQQVSRSGPSQNILSASPTPPDDASGQESGAAST